MTGRQRLALVRVAHHFPPSHAYQSVLKRHDPGRLLVGLLATIVVGFAILVVAQRIETMRRTGTAQISIVATELQPGSGYE